MWSYPTSLSTYWAASLCTMKWVTDLVDQAFPLCCQARMRTEQGRSEGDRFPCPPPRAAPPAFGREVTLLFGTWVWSIFFPLTCLWTAATSYLPSPMFASVSSPLLLMPILKLWYLAAFPQSCLPFHKTFLLPSAYTSSTFPLPPQIPPWEPVLCSGRALHQMITFIRSVATTGRYGSQDILCNFMMFFLFYCWQLDFSDAS